MASLLSSYEYDIFISYRHNDNRSGWVTEFVGALQEELASTIKEPLSIYFDQNPHNGLLETHDVDDSLKEKLKCLIFISIISQTYCDPKSFAWRNEFLVFLQLAGADSIGLKVKLRNGNTASRILPIRIHELDVNDKKIIETELGPLRAIDFTYQSAGVNRPLRPKDDDTMKGNTHNVYRDQVNKTANAIKEIIAGLKGEDASTSVELSEKVSASVFATEQRGRRKRSIKIPGIKTFLTFCLTLILMLSALLIYTNFNHNDSNGEIGNVMKTSINLPDSISMSFMAGPLRTGRRAVDISPDGKTIVFVSMDQAGTSYLNLRPIGQENVSRLHGTKGAFSPFFSPDSKWIAFFSNDKLMKISVDGGVMETLTQTANPIDGIWGEDDRIIWMANESSSFNSIDSHGKDRKVMKSTMRFSSRPIRLSSDEFIVTNTYSETYVVSFTKGIGKLILSNGSCQTIYNDDLYFIKGTDLFAIDFDRDEQMTLGNPRLIEKGISIDVYRNGQFAISKNGTLVYANGTHFLMGHLVWTNNKGGVTNLPFDSQLYGTFSLSPDGMNVAIIKRGDHQSEVWNYDLMDPKNNILLSQQGFHQGVIWSPNSNWIYYQSYQNGKSHIVRSETAGRSDAELILSNDSLRFLTDLNKEGVILYMNVKKDGFTDLNFFSTENPNIRYSFTSRKGVNETLAKFIPEDWVAFTSDQTGRSEVFISDLLNPAIRIQVSFEGGEEPRYNAAGNNLYYRNGNKLMAATLVFDANRKSTIGVSKIIFEDDNWVNVPGHSYDISPDGKQFLLVRGERRKGTTEIKVLQNVLNDH